MYVQICLSFFAQTLKSLSPLRIIFVAWMLGTATMTSAHTTDPVLAVAEHHVSDQVAMTHSAFVAQASYSAQWDYLVDSGASSFITNDLSHLSSYTQDPSEQIVFSIAGKGKTYSSAVGVASLQFFNNTTGETDRWEIDNVAYCKNSPYKLMSSGFLKNKGITVNDKHTYLSYDSGSNSLYNKDHNYSIHEKENFLPFIRPVVINNQTEEAAFPIFPAVDQTDWMLSTEEFDKLNRQFGPFECELFADDGHFNAHLPDDCFSPSDSCFNHSWAGKNVYGNAPYDSKVLEKTLSKALQDFSEDPMGTSITLIVPAWKNQTYWKYIKYFDKVAEFPKGSSIFSIPKQKLFTAKFGKT
jgi:hypothetical protein